MPREYIFRRTACPVPRPWVRPSPAPSYYPGDLVCTVTGLQGDDKRELVRMLVNSLIWIVLGMGIAAVLT